MGIAIVIAFILGYIFIVLEHPVGINKAATALLTGVICWLILAFAPQLLSSASSTASGSSEIITGALFEHLGSISEILFFLLGAMTIVELVDAHNGFRVITDRINTTDRIKLLWVLCWVAFFLSAVLDNLTTTIVMCALIRKLVKTKEDMWVMGGFVIIAANAGGAWSPIGDVTTIMLWIGGQVTSLNIIRSTFLASVVSLIVPLMAASYFLRRRKLESEEISLAGFGHMVTTTPFEQKLLFVLGCLGLLAVPVFKAITHLPPYMGILLSLGLLWVVTEWMHRKKPDQHKHELSVGYMLHRIDSTSILFFLGILLAVGALASAGLLNILADTLNHTFGNIYIINTLIGLLSAIVDNVPLVAASMGMYDLTYFPPDHDFWELLAYCAGTGGSILVIGSAAGVAAMGILKMDFIWYLKRISIYAALGYFAGIFAYYVQHHL